jgi:osmotically-inducible protein OsmY
MHYRGLIVSFLFLITACSQQQKDKGIKQMIATAAKEEVAFTGVNYSVEKGLVTLSGICPTEQEKAKVESKVKQTAGVKEVMNLITIAPVVLDGSHLLKRSVDSVLMKYPAIEASVEDSVIYLQGQVKNKDAEKIMSGLQSLGAKAITNQLQMSSVQ